MMNNLWPENIGQTGDNLTPLTILQEQAKLLGERTQNIVTADTETVIDDENSKPFIHDFYIVAPLLRNFRYRLLEITHDIELYPLNVYADQEIINESEGRLKTEKDYTRGKTYIKVNDEAEFIDTLKVIFSSKKGKRIITNLMSQSKPLRGYVAHAEDDVPF